MKGDRMDELDFELTKDMEAELTNGREEGHDEE